MRGHRRFLLIGLAAAASVAAFGCGHRPSSQTGENRPPVITEAVILPEQPTPDAQVSLKMEAGDPDGDQVSYQVEWLVNGQVRAEGPGIVFSTKGLEVGDRIAARIVPWDGMLQGQAFQTEEIALWPKVLSLDSLKIEPSPLISGLEQVRAVPFVAGGEKLDQLRFVCKWTLDGKALNDSGTVISLPPLKVGQRLVVEASPVIGIKKGHPYRVMATVVGAPPVIKGVSFVKQEAGVNIYRVEAEDPNGQPLNFTLVKSPPGVNLDPKSGELRIPVNLPAGGIRVKVANGSGSFVEKDLE